jgi:uncharacterized protein YkwD
MSIKLFVSGLAAVLSIGSVAPAFARPAIAPGYDNNYGYNTSRAHFDEQLEQKVLELVNDIRYRKGLGELRLDNRSVKSARLVAKEAGAEGGFGDIDHSLFERLTAQGLDLSRRVFGETRAVIDQDEDLDLMARRIVKSWSKNTKFSKVIFNDEISYVGVAAYINKEGEVMVVLNAFGAERQPAPQPQYPQYPQYPQPTKGCGGY